MRALSTATSDGSGTWSGISQEDARKEREKERRAAEAKAKSEEARAEKARKREEAAAKRAAQVGFMTASQHQQGHLFGLART